MRVNQDFSLTGMLLLLTVLGFASWAVTLPPLVFDREFLWYEVLVRLLIVWELGIVPIVFLRWRKRRVAAEERRTSTPRSAAVLMEPLRAVNRLCGKPARFLAGSQMSELALGLLALLATVFGLATAWQRAASRWIEPPNVEISIGSPVVAIASPGNARTGERFVEFSVQYSNDGFSDLWVYGHSTAHPFYQLFTRPVGASDWHEHGPLFCGTGAQNYRILAGHSDSFRIFVSESYSGQEMRIALPVFASASGDEYSEVYTEAVRIP